MWYNTGMTSHDILSNAFVVTSGGTRLAQFRKCLDAAGLPAEPGRFEAFDVCGGRPVSLTGVALALAGALGAEPVFTDGGPTPAWEPVRMEGDGSRAAELLGWAPSTPFEDGVRAFADWFRASVPG